MRVKFKKRMAKFSTKVRDIQEIVWCSNNTTVVNKALGDLVEDELLPMPWEVLDMGSSRVMKDLSTMAWTKHSYLKTVRHKQPYPP